MADPIMEARLMQALCDQLVYAIMGTTPDLGREGPYTKGNSFFNIKSRINMI
jgi:hypothetical protein